VANYCANSIVGNDANSGAYNPAVPDDWSTAKRTIGAMVAAMASGDTGYVTGYFNEAVAASSKALTFRGVGLAIWSGVGLGAITLYSAHGPISGISAFYDFIFEGSDGYVCSQSYYSSIRMERCVVRNCANGVRGTNGKCYQITLYSCLFVGRGTGTGLIVPGYQGSPSYLTMQGSTLVDWGIAINATGPTIWGMNDSFLSSPVMILEPTVAEYAADYNCLDFSGTNKTTIGGINYDTLALHQAGTGLDLNSLDSTPAAECVDTTRNLYGLRPISQLLRRGSAGRDIGWGGAMLAVSPGINADVYDNPYVVSGAIVKDGSGYWMRDAVSTAVARFGDPTGLLLADLGAARNVGQLLLEGTETFHMSQFDQAAGVGPYLTVRYKLSATQDALSDGAGWTVLKRHGRIDVATYRYFGLEVTWMGP